MVKKQIVYESNNKHFFLPILICSFLNFMGISQKIILKNIYVKD